jgi:hypothetical protein
MKYLISGVREKIIYIFKLINIVGVLGETCVGNTSLIET